MVNTPPAVAALLCNEEKAQVAALEQAWGVTLVIQGDNDMAHDQFEVLSL
jgi:Ribonuclease G/E